MSEKYEQFVTMEFSNGIKVDCFITKNFKFFYGNCKRSSKMFDSLTELQDEIKNKFGESNWISEGTVSKFMQRYNRLLKEKVENKRFIIEGD